MLTDEEMDEQGTGECRFCYAPHPMPIFNPSGEVQTHWHCYNCATTWSV